MYRKFTQSEGLSKKYGVHFVSKILKWIYKNKNVARFVKIEKKKLFSRFLRAVDLSQVAPVT